jgi:hypothetical protein
MLAERYTYLVTDGDYSVVRVEPRSLLSPLIRAIGRFPAAPFQSPIDVGFRRSCITNLTDSNRGYPINPNMRGVWETEFVSHF